MQRVGQGPDVRVAEPLAVWPLVKHLQGGDLVPILLDVITEGADEIISFHPGKLRPDHRVLGYRVDGLLVDAVDLNQPLPQFRVGREGLGCGFCETLLGCCDGIFRWVIQTGGLLRLFQRGVGVGGVQQVRHSSFRVAPPATSSTAFRSSGESRRSRRTRRLAKDDRVSGSRSPMATMSSSLSKGTDG